MEQEFAPYPYSKWLTDKFVSLALIVMFSPVFIVVILGMALSMLLRPADRGAWLYREQRFSQGQKFNVLKFRVLREDVLAQIQHKNDHARIYEADISNLTWAGRYLLKKWYFDELPQLFNVLKGDMSLVGPRPWPVHMVEDQIARGVIYRNLIRAGWTGPSQLQKGNPTPQDSEQLDLEYLNRCRTWSQWQLWQYDMSVLYQTARTLLEGKGLIY